MITKSSVESHHSSDGTTYSVKIEFRYEYAGQVYTGGSYDFNSSSSSGRDGKQAIVKQYPTGSKASCWVDPENPETAVLSRDIPKIVYFVIPFTAIFMIVGLAIMLGALGLLPKQWKHRISSKHKPIANQSAGAGELQPSSSGIAKLLGMICICIFWNGIVSVFVLQVIDGFQKGNPEWFLVLFMTPFVVIGLGFLGGIVYFALALRNPSLSIKISEASPQLGQRIQLSWQSSGSLKRLESMSILLEGREAATYRRGTNSRTDHSTFYQGTLLDSQTPAEQAFGSLEFEVPTDSMHSFNGGNNKIEWRLRVEGSIRKWPDMKADYPITVRPRALS